MLTFWIRPAAALLFWLLLAATTLSELGTLPPHRTAHTRAAFRTASLAQRVGPHRW